MNTTVTPHIGFYSVTTVDRWGIQTHQVGKDRRCTCGGSGKHPCRHIQAVAAYLKAGGKRAPERRLHESVPPAVPPATCPICDVPVASEGNGRWSCPNNASHYFQWRGEQGVRQFLTQPHPNKMGGFYDQTVEERDAFVNQAARRTYAGGYTPFN